MAISTTNAAITGESGRKRGASGPGGQQPAALLPEAGTGAESPKATIWRARARYAVGKDAFAVGGRPYMPPGALTLSGCSFIANFRYALVIVFSSAFFSTPSRS